MMAVVIRACYGVEEACLFKWTFFGGRFISIRQGELFSQLHPHQTRSTGFFFFDYLVDLRSLVFDILIKHVLKLKLFALFEAFCWLLMLDRYCLAILFRVSKTALFVVQVHFNYIVYLQFPFWPPQL